MQVQHAFVDYAPKVNILQSLTGKKTAARSVLRDVNLHINVGSWLTLFGKAGTGKSTLLRLLTGALTPSQGTVNVNGKHPMQNSQAAAGYVSSEEFEETVDTVSESLEAFIKTHHLSQGSARLGEVAEGLHIKAILDRSLKTLSVTERLKVNLARAIISNAPLLLLDGVADELGANEVASLLDRFCQGRTVVIATRFTQTAETLGLPILLLHNGTLAHYGTCEHIATEVACPRIVDAWVEGLRYDVLRNLRRHPGVKEVRLIATDQFAGQKLRIIAHSSRYLPGIYDLLSQTELVKVQEVPPSLVDILAKL